MKSKNVLRYVPTEFFDTDRDTRPGPSNLDMLPIAFFAVINGVNALNFYRLTTHQLNELKDLEWKLLTESVPGPY